MKWFETMLGMAVLAGTRSAATLTPVGDKLRRDWHYTYGAVVWHCSWPPGLWEGEQRRAAIRGRAP